MSPGPPAVSNLLEVTPLVHQLGLTAADIAVLLEQDAHAAPSRLDTLRTAQLNAGVSPEEAERMAFVLYLHEFASHLLEANNRKIAADLVRLGVLHGTLTRNGEATF